MNRNVMGMAKINDNEALNLTKPKGFIVRERLVDGNPVSLEYGVYLSDDVFLGVPLHFNLKKNLIMGSIPSTEDFNYYLVPQLMQFAVKTYTSKKSEKLNPILVEPTEENPAVFISCLTFGNNMDKILNVTIDENSLVVRKYIDKDRNLIGLILMNTDTGSINPTTTVTIEYGVVGMKKRNIDTYTFNPVEYDTGFTMHHAEETSEEPLSTSFINLKSFIEPPKTEKTKSERDNNGSKRHDFKSKKSFNNKKFNNNKKFD